MATRPDGLLDEIISRLLPVNDLNMHILEAGDPSLPLVILLHGFPELAYSWRKVIVPIAQMGFHVVAPDMRGYGQTTSRTAPSFPIRFEDDLGPFRVINIVRDVVALVFALGYTSVASIVGHDMGSGVAALCALIRPAMFRSLVIMSTPFPGPPPLLFKVDPVKPPPSPLNIFSPEVKVQLAALDPPRKYYVPYFAGEDANRDMMNAPRGLHAFIRAYYHMKSADWPLNEPRPLDSPDPAKVAELPHYYMMPLEATMPQAVEPHAPSADEVAANTWLTERELAVYVSEYGRTGFQGGLNGYRAYQPQYFQELQIFSGQKIEVPAMFLAGKQDWGVFQIPGALDRMKSQACSNLAEEDLVLVDGAGHWVQQEKPERTVLELKRFFAKVSIQ
ncbi:uncharacterized protein FIBRA_00218 [Fibroporia radiculosa]|uniref:AB hydrolase-1 domain-containing protein n=1 Tax=Fibroporia radiculosa TaxID=599839 RepID=J7S5U2_9APHY|nr:uncharacterized protein FIBRA_00218 [Fibroporia radiculosa]CCL98224.1 predicted protein [Fibroporia radiculosa]